MKLLKKQIFWKNIVEDCKSYVGNCIIWIKLRGGKKLTIEPKQIISKGARERYVVDGWKLHPELTNKYWYLWVIDIIDYFSRFMGSFPIIENNSINVLTAIKEFCYYVGILKITQTDNGLEYVNKLFNEFCNKNNINCDKNVDLKNILLDAINCHNHNIHSSTSFRPSDIFNNTDEDIKKKFMIIWKKIK